MSHQRTKIAACALTLLLCASTVLSLATLTAAEPVEVRVDMTPLDLAVAWPNVASVGENIYVMGGTTSYTLGGGTTYDTVQIYNVDTGETTYGTKMPKGVAGGACGAGPDGKIYIAGGWNVTDGSYYGRVQIYDPVLDSWDEAVSDTPEYIGRSASAMAPDGTLYVFGGGWMSNVTLIYDTQSDVWQYGLDQPVTGYDGDAVFYSSTAVYRIGGTYGGATSSVSVYNPVADTWSSVEPMPAARDFSCSVLARTGDIYVFGGASSSSMSDPAPLSSVLRYSVADDAWEVSDETLGSGRDHMSVVTDPYDRAVVVGGYDGAAAVDDVEAFVISEIPDLYSIQISSPQDGSIVSGVVEVQVDALNGWGMWSFDMIDLYVDGALYESRYDAFTATFQWDATGMADGSFHTLMARGYAPDGSVMDDSVTVTVSAQSVEETVAALQQQLADVQMQLYLMALAMAEANASTMEYLEDQLAILQNVLNQIGVGLATMGTGQTAAMDALNLTLADLQSQLDDFQEQIDRVENKADTAGTYGIVTMVLVIIVVVLVALMVMMARKKP